MTQPIGKVTGIKFVDDELVFSIRVFKKRLSLLDAIDICHNGKDVAIEYTWLGSVYTLTEDAKKELDIYMDASSKVESHKRLAKFLKLINYI